MQAGLISKILDYHYTNHAVDFLIAADVFFGKNKGNSEVMEKHQALFFEWLVFDYKLPDGKSFLENYLAKNISVLSESEISECHSLLETNLFGIFEVLKIQKGEGMLVEDIVSEKKYDVKEKLGTYQIHQGDLVLSRVGKIDNHWEFVSGKITSMGQFEIDRRISAEWKNDKNRLTPKTVFESFYSKNKKSEVEAEYETMIDSQKARVDLEWFLKKNRLLEHISAELIEKWLYEEGENGAFLESAENLGLVFFGLLLDRDDRNEIIGKAMPLLSAFANSVGRKRFDGKSPQQMASENRQKEIDPSWKSSMRQISANGVDFFAQGSILMKEQSFGEAQAKFEEGFASLLKEKIPIIDIYRAYANMAVCLFSQGKVTRGKKLLKISLEINPTYGFAKKTLNKLENGFFDQAIAYGRVMTKENGRTKKDGKNNLHKNSAEEFYDFLKSTGINFATKEPPFEMVSTLNGKKIPRNEPCPCGSGKKYKKCCMNA